MTPLILTLILPILRPWMFLVVTNYTTSTLICLPYFLLMLLIVFYLRSWYCSIPLWTRQSGGGVLKIGYECAAGNFNYHLIAEPERNQLCNPYQLKIICFTLRSMIFSTNATIFSQLILKLKVKMKRHPISLSLFSKKKKIRAIVKPQGQKGYYPQPHIRVPTFPLSTHKTM